MTEEMHNCLSVVPKIQFRAEGALLFPGQPGYEEELARIKARHQSSAEQQQIQQPINDESKE